MAASALPSLAIAAEPIGLPRDALLQPSFLQIPKQPLDRTKREDKLKKDEQRASDPWRAQDEVYEAQGNLPKDRREAWRRFHDDARRENHAFIQIDGPVPARTPAPRADGIQEHASWRVIAEWHRAAACFEEDSRCHASLLGGDGSFSAEASEDAPRSPGIVAASPKRRRFRVDHPFGPTSENA